MSAIDPRQLIAALTVNGWIEVYRRDGQYARLVATRVDRRATLVVPLNPDAGDYEALLREVVGGLEDAARDGLQAQAILGALGAEQPRLPNVVDLDEAMGSVWLHGDWRWLTRNMTTEQREAAADAVARWSMAADHADGEPPRAPGGLRWWRE